MYSSEIDAVRCVSETNGITYKGQNLRVKFEDGSLEDSPRFQRQYLNLFRNYPRQLVPAPPTPANGSTTQSRDRFHETPFRPKTFQTIFYPQILALSKTQHIVIYMTIMYNDF
jgi:hypothetical protein